MRGGTAGLDAERKDSDDLFSDVKKEEEGKTRMIRSPMSRETMKSIDMSMSTRMLDGFFFEGSVFGRSDFFRKSRRFAGALCFSQIHNQHQHQYVKTTKHLQTNVL